MEELSEELITVLEAASLVERKATTIHAAIRAGALVPAQRKATRGPGMRGVAHLLRREDVLALWPPRADGQRKRRSRAQTITRACASCGRELVLPAYRLRSDRADQQHFYCSRPCAGQGLRSCPEGMSVREAAAVLGCTFQNVQQLHARGTLPDLLPETVLAFKQERDARLRRWARRRVRGQAA